MTSRDEEPIQLSEEDQVPIDDDDLLANAIPIDDVDDASAAEPIPVKDPAPAAGSSKIRAFNTRESHQDKWTRKPNVTGHGAIHVRTFVAKLRPDAIEHLDHQINEWLDSNPEYEVKFVTTNVGELMSKMKEPALFVNVWV